MWRWPDSPNDLQLISVLFHFKYAFTTCNVFYIIERHISVNNLVLIFEKVVSELDLKWKQKVHSMII